MPVVDDVRWTVGKNVKMLRESRSLSVKECADHIGVHRSYWNMVENGDVNFTIEKLELIAQFFHITVQDLMKRL